MSPIAKLIKMIVQTVAFYQTESIIYFLIQKCISNVWYAFLSK